VPSIADQEHISYIIQRLHQLKYMENPMLWTPQRLTQVLKNMNHKTKRSFAQTYGQLLYSIKNVALRTYHWPLMIEIGSINSTIGMEAFIETLDYSFLDDEMKKNRAKSFNIFLQDVSVRVDLLVDDYLDALFTCALDLSASNGDIEFLKVLTSDDLHNLRVVDPNHIVSLNKKFGWAVSSLWADQIHLIRKEEHFWIMWAITRAAKTHHQEAAEFLFSLVKDDLEIEEPFLKQVTQSLAEKHRWKHLTRMLLFAQKFVLDALISKCKDPEILFKNLKLIDLLHLPNEKKKELYSTFLDADLIGVMDENILQQLKSGLTEDELIVLQQEKELKDEAKCQICMQENIQCFFSCQDSEKYRHGACNDCFNMVMNAENPKCPWCRQKLKKKPEAKRRFPRFFGIRR
jgi:hypothetical protein